MKKKIKAQIDNINTSLEWIKKHKPADYEQRFLQLVEGRRVLNTILAAESNNPGIAAFGKSQVGKSYLISCLLQGYDNNGVILPFMVKTSNESYDFVKQINPPSEEGGGRESTGVVSRFSSFERNPDSYNMKYPVLINTFSVADIIIMLSDSYYNDFSDYNCPGENELAELCEKWHLKYATCTPITQSIITPDEILNIKTYFSKHINNAQTFNKSTIFDILALFIDRIPQYDYLEVFSNFWSKQSVLTELFRKLLEIIEGFKYSKCLYLPIESVVHRGIRENTIMSVQCLKQLFNKSTYQTDVYIKDGENFEKIASNISKSEISAICSEVVFKIDKDFLSSERPFAWENMSSDVKARITHENVKMEMLKTNDLLDFPGARAREQEQLSKLSIDNVLDFFLRGKVAYLFNKYNEEMGINILLYCHHNKDNDVTNLYKLLEDWVDNYVGRTPEERRRKINITKKSPLFYIGTMFNLDMKSEYGSEMTEESMSQRWIGRFDTVVNNQCFHRKTADWVKNWTAKNEDFNNSYILRDYKFSKDLYEGFVENKREIKSKMTDEYFSMMRKTFIENEHVKRLFADPAMSWDVATTMANDGALFIIQNLTEVASRMDKARESDFIRTLDTVATKIYNTMSSYFVSTDIDKILEGNIRKAKAIFRELDFTCNNDNYYFGHLLQALQISESESYRTIHKVIQGPEINGKVNDFKDYEIIRNSCEKAGYSIDLFSTETEKINCVIETYGFNSVDEVEEYFIRKGIDKQKLLSGSYKRKLNSCIIADSVYDKWCSAIRSVDFFNEFTKENSFDTIVMNDLVDEIIMTADILGVRDKMSELIAEYVDIVDVHAANESFIADVLADTINDFVLDFGFSMLSDEDKLKAKGLCEKRNLPAFKYIEKELPAEMDEQALTALFNDMSANPKALLPSFEDNYNKWLEYMFISFVAHLDIPDFDQEANSTLEILLDKIKTVEV